MRRVIGLAAVAIVGLAAVAVVGPAEAPQEWGDHRDPRDERPDTVAAAAGMQAFDACDALVDHLQEVTAAAPARRLGSAGGGLEMMMDEEVSATAAEGGSARAAVTGTSDTNAQVAGVDEPDLVETDGRRLFTVAGGTLQVVDLSGDRPTSSATVDLALPMGVGEAELLLDGDRLLVVARAWADQGVGVRGAGAHDRRADVAMPMGAPITSVVLLDVSADHPRPIASAELDGELVAGRGVDGTAHLVIAHRPQPLPIDVLDDVWSVPNEQDATRRMREALEATRVTDWLPAIEHVDADGVVTTAPSVACQDVARPVETADTSMLEVVTIDLRGDDVLPEASTAVLTDARTVTASATQLVVATPVWARAAQPLAGGVPARDVVAPAPQDVTTRLHLFDLGPQGTTHRASGEVPGTLLNQFSMSLHEGTLRVATTTGEWAEATESGVTVLRATGDRLEAIGAVGGLGRGETIHAVRFLGDQAYVVTFRQTDPLYTIDLSDPTAPRVTGELKITGYSAYLHPLGDQRLLGVGQEATLEGQTTGTQVSVFDVADPAAPTRLSQVLLPGANSEAEWDHHAVLVHDDLVVLPYERWGPPTDDRPEGHEAGALVLALDDGAVSLRGTVATTTGPEGDPWQATVRRAVVVDGRLVTVSGTGIAVHDPVSLATTGTLAW